MGCCRIQHYECALVSCSHVLKRCILLEAVKLTNFCRFLSDESAMVTAYGFPDIEFNKYSTVHSKDGSSYFFVPQVKWH